MVRLAHFKRLMARLGGVCKVIIQRSISINYSMGKIKIILFCLFYFTSSVGFSKSGYQLRDKVQNTYISQLFVRELTGNNDGIQVEKYLKYVWLKKGQPWCASFVSWSFGQNGITKARSGGCVQLMEQGKTIYKSGKTTEVPQKADVFFIYYSDKGRVAHTGFVDNWGTDFVTTVEGNTNGAGSREGNGVYRKKRIKRQIYAVSKYI
tara:strand:- start:2518 stop:3138 length:621 start_codon:yes stop_codon:yes gene_type:complete